ncbi:NYN domain-containing protein [bacterium]|nr:NYN domain-containing protein [bacterium]
MVFIDGSNLYKSLKKASILGKIDYRKMVTEIVSQFNFDVVLRRVYFYSALPDQNREQDSYRKSQKFLDKIKRWDLWEVRYGRLVYYPNSVPVEKGVDIKIASDMIENAILSLYDIAILVSGDADFSYCFNVIKNLNKQIAVVKMPAGFSYQLAENADYILNFLYKK